MEASERIPRSRIRTVLPKISFCRADFIGQARRSQAGLMQIAFIFGDAVEHGQVLLYVHQALAVVRRFEQQQRLHHSELVVLGSDFQTCQEPLGLRDALEPIRQLARAAGSSEKLNFTSLRAVPFSKADRFGSHERDFERRFERMIEVSQLFHQAENLAALGLRQLKAHGVVVILRFLVIARAGFVQSDRHEGRRAAGERLRVIKVRRIGRLQAQARDQQQNTPSSRQSPCQPRPCGRIIRVANGHRQRIAEHPRSAAIADSSFSVSDRTIICTWRLPACPYPTTLVLISSGEYSPKGITRFGNGQQRKRRAHARKFQGRADIGGIKHLLDCRTRQEGACRRITSRKPPAISASRFSKGIAAAVRNDLPLRSDS